MDARLYLETNDGRITLNGMTDLPIEKDGSLGKAISFFQHVGGSVNPERQKEPHSHSIVVSPDNRFAFAADLGLDKVLIYKVDAAKGTMTPNDPPSCARSPRRTRRAAPSAATPTARCAPRQFRDDECRRAASAPEG